MHSGSRRFSVAGRRTEFQPAGELVARGRGAKAFASNPALWASPPVPTARLFVGMNVGDAPVWSLSDVIAVVKTARVEQTGDPSSSFVTQKGIYRHDDGGGIVEEDSAQVIIYNLSEDVDAEEFEEQMVDVATQLARVLQQELVLLEIQKGGRAVKTIGVGP